jgi:hypothetical protein
MAEVTNPHELPSAEELDIIDHMLGGFLSELSDLVFVLEHAGDPPGRRAEDDRGVPGAHRGRRHIRAGAARP